MIYLSLGSNLGDRFKQLDQACVYLSQIVKIKAISPIYETPAWGVTNQPGFYNLCLACTTRLDPLSLLEQTQNIEKQMGRVKSYAWGPRCIDIDILLYHDYCLNDARLTLPHPYMHKRGFVLCPLIDIAPALIIPGFKQSISVMYEELKDSEPVQNQFNQLIKGVIGYER